MMREAAKIGPATIALVEAIMKAKPHPEQGFRACLGILRLARSYGSARSRPPAGAATTSAPPPTARSPRSCSMGSIGPTRREQPPEGPPIQHGNIRGTGYYH